MSMLTCHQCGITSGELHGKNPEDWFTPTDKGLRCTNCLRYGTRPDEVKDILVAANRARRTTLARLKLAEDCASLFRDHLAGCVDTQRETDALTEWEYAADVRPIVEDDTLRSEL